MNDTISESLCVHWDGILVGRYQRFESGSEQFVYDSGYLSSKSAQPISHSLPLRADAYSRSQLRPFFAGLLPEEKQRDQIASYLGLKRYDRVLDETTERVVRVHQEDFCQAMGRMPEQKYQSDGGPLVREIVRLLRSGWSTAPALDVVAFVDLLIFNTLIGNADAHGKNYSMLYRGTSRRLAPGYDLVSTVYWSALAKSPAMKIGGCDSIDSICYGHWKKMAEELSFGFAQLLRRIRELCRSAGDATTASLGLPADCDPIIALIHDRARRIEKTTAK